MSRSATVANPPPVRYKPSRVQLQPHPLPPRYPSLHHHHHSLASMDPPAAPRPFDPFFDVPLPNDRSVHSSIWAPQPQPSETAWSKAIDSFTHVDSNGHPVRPDPRRASSFPSNCEDVFGAHATDPRMRKNVGAIGDGRKKDSPSLEQTVRCQYAAYMRAYTGPDAFGSTSSNFSAP